jgi:Toxin PAAR-like domain/GHH signature containing HNH/Endo VII superfamily nuclease toxin  2
VANQVFANGREIACKAGAGKTVCAMPDVCFTPPENPATPPGVPVPYPNTGFASDTTEGSKSVKISGEEIMLKNSSCFKKSTGDEAGCAAKKGVITSKNTGKVYFNAWSMDVKFEGENADRHLDLTTNNHASQAGDTPPWPFADSMAIDEAGKTDDPCAEEKANEKAACSKHGDDRGKQCADSACQRAQACKLVPYGGSGSPNCCPGVTGDHLVEASSFSTARTGGTSLAGCGKYNLNEAPTCCAEGGAYSKDHGFLSVMRGDANTQCPVADLPLQGGGTLSGQRATTYAQAAENGARSVRSVFTQCDEECIRAQLDTYHHGCGIKDDTKLRAITYGDSVKWIQRLM